MTEQTFEKELEKKCFGYGQGALYFKNHYKKAKKNEQPLIKLIEEVQTDLCWDDAITPEHNHDLLNMPISTLPEQLTFLEAYFETHCFLAYPELIGSIIGSLASTKNFQEAYDFLGLNNVKNEIEWDS